MMKKITVEDWSFIFLTLLVAVFFVYKFLPPRHTPVLGTFGFGSYDVFDQDFTFTISPDDRWLVFPVTPFQEDINLVVVDLDEDRSFTFSLEKLNERDEPSIMGFRYECWSFDSKYCLYPIIYDQGNKRVTAEHDRSNTPQIILDLTGEEPKVVEQYHWEDNTIRIFDLNPSGSFTCSDCASLGEQFPDGIVEWGRPSWDDLSSVTKGGMRYFVSTRGERSNEIIEEILDSEQTRVVYSASGLREIYLDYLRLSPDGQHLAFQESRGVGSFVSSPTLKILNIRTGKVRKIANKVFYDMHWSSDSNKIYYNRGRSAFPKSPNGLFYYEL